MADTKISALPSATPQSGDQFPFVRDGVTSRGPVFTVGTWTPVLDRASSSPSVTYTNQQGVYFQIGRLVFAEFNITASSISGGSGFNQVTGFPGTRDTSNIDSWGGVITASTALSSTTATVFTLTTAFRMQAAGGASNINENYAASGNLRGFIFYFVT